jgi:hypothetical protein
VGENVIHDRGYFKLWRELFSKPIWLKSTPEQKTILVTLIAMANFKEKEWEWQGKKFKVKPGQFVTSLDSIVKECGEGITIKNVRTALARFEKLDFLANQSTKTGRLITIVNWHLYQSENEEGDKECGKEVAKDGQRGGKEVAPKEEGKKDKNKKKNTYGEYENIKLTDTQYQSLLNDYGEEKLTQLIKMVDEGIQMKGYKYKDFNLAIRNWAKRGGYKCKEINTQAKKQEIRVVVDGYL